MSTTSLLEEEAELAGHPHHSGTGWIDARYVTLYAMGSGFFLLVRSEAKIHPPRICRMVGDIG